MDTCDPQAQKLTASEVVNIRTNCSHTLPVIGFKEFQPSNTLVESKQIEDALQKQADMLAMHKVDKLSFLSAAEWKADRKLALVTRRAGGHFEVMGREEETELWLYAEEILLLLEMSRAELWFEGVTMSIQQGYAMLLGKDTGCRDIDYAVYKHLSHLGYRILRHTSCRTQYELAIRLNQCSARSTRKLVIQEKDITCVTRMPAALLEEDPSEIMTDCSHQELIELPPVNLSSIAPLEMTVQSISRSSSGKGTPEPLDDTTDYANISSDKFPSEFVVLDEWVAADESDNPENNTNALITDDDDREIIGITLDSKEMTENVAQDISTSEHKPPSQFVVMDEIAEPGSPKILADRCPQILPQSPAVITETDTNEVSNKTSVNSPENYPTPSAETVKENDISEEIEDDDAACIFSDLNAFLAEICPSPKLPDDISLISAHAESDFIAVSGVDTSETVLNSLAEVNASGAVDDGDDTDIVDDDNSNDYFGELKPGFNVVIRQNMCPVLFDVPEPANESEAGILSHGKRQAETSEATGPRKKSRFDETDEEVTAIVTKQGGAVDRLEIAGASDSEKLVNGDSTAMDCVSDSVSTSSVSEDDQGAEQCVDASDSEMSEDDDCLNLSAGKELESPEAATEESSDLEVIELGDVEELSVTISNKRKQTDDDVRIVKRRPAIEVVNLSDEDTESEGSDADSDADSADETEDLNQADTDDDTDVVSIGSSIDVVVDEPPPARKKFWDPALLEDEDRTQILKSIVNVADKTQVLIDADWRYVPLHCEPVRRRVKVFRLNAIGIGGKPSVDYVPAHMVIESRAVAADARPPSPSPFDHPSPFDGPAPSISPWVQVGARNFQPNYQMTVHNPHHVPPWQRPPWQPPPWQPPPAPWQQPSSAFIAPGNVGYAIPSSLGPPRHPSPLIHVVATPRMQNRTIRGVAKAPRPSYGGPAAHSQSHGWFQQNNVFGEPNALRVELPPPVKPEPWNPGIMRPVKGEEKPSVAVKREAAGVLIDEGVWYDLAKDRVPIGDFTVQKIFDVCRQDKNTRIKNNQRKRLRREWMRMVESKSFNRSAETILLVFERKSSLLAGLTSNIRNAFSIDRRPAGAVIQSVAVKEELGVPSRGIASSKANVAQLVAGMTADCPSLTKLTPLQVDNLKKALQAKVRGTKQLTPVQVKVLVYVGRTMTQYVNKIVRGLVHVEQPTSSVISSLLEWAELVKVNRNNTYNPVKMIEKVRQQFQIGNFPADNRIDNTRTAEKAVPTSVPDEGANDENSSDSDENVYDTSDPLCAEITDVKSLVAKIRDWIVFPQTMTSQWIGTEQRLLNGYLLTRDDFKVLHFAQANDPKLGDVLPVMINRTYMRDENVLAPTILELGATEEDCRQQVDELVSVCPWLNTFGERLESVRTALNLKAAGQSVSKNCKYVLRSVCSLIIQTVKSILRENQQPSKVVNALVQWANYLKVSENKYDLTRLIKTMALYNEAERISRVATKENAEMINNEVMGDDGLPDGQENSAEDSDEESDENAEENSEDAQSESSNSEKFDDLLPVDFDISDKSGKLNLLVVNIGAWLTLSPAQHEMWWQAKERMAYDMAFTSADYELFRFAISSDERFRELEQLVDFDCAEANKETIEPIPRLAAVQADVLTKIKEMAVACPLLTCLTGKQIETLKIALLRKECGDTLSEEHRSVLVDVREKIIEDALHILNDVAQPTSEVDRLIRCANFVTLGEKLDSTTLVEMMKMQQLEEESEDEAKKEEEIVDEENTDSENETNNEDEAPSINTEEESPDRTCQSSNSEEEIVEPLLKPSDCIDFATVMSKLAIIKPATNEQASDGRAFKIMYDLYVPNPIAAKSTPFRKSDPGIPDFRVIVLSPEDRIPDSDDLFSLSERCPDRVPVLFAIVRAGTVSFLRLDTVRLPDDLTEYGAENAS